MKIKKLVWDKCGDGFYEAPGFWGYFQVEATGYEDDGFTASLNDMNDYDGFESEDFATIKDAKEYCQYLLEKQVRMALEFVED